MLKVLIQQNAGGKFAVNSYTGANIKSDIFILT